MEMDPVIASDMIVLWSHSEFNMNRRLVSSVRTSEMLISFG